MFFAPYIEFKVSVLGDKAIILAQGSSFKVIDISDPENPTELAEDQ